MTNTLSLLANVILDELNNYTPKFGRTYSDEIGGDTEAAIRELIAAKRVSVFDRYTYSGKSVFQLFALDENGKRVFV